LILIVEDLHWIDPASEEYLTFMSDAVAAARAMLVCSHRPGYRHPFGDRSYHTRIAIRALTDPEMALMTSALLGAADIPTDLRALIARKAEGNPFFVEEVTKSLLEEGALRRENGDVVLARDIADVSIPDRIQDVIMARIDRLPDDRKHAIQLASVIGREFVLRLLERIAALADAVGPLVEELRGLELVYEKAAHPELAYMFKHALTHEVAYGSILIQRRKGLHRTIGAAIEEIYVDRLAEHTETLAHHFTLAEDWERALEYRGRAAEKALGSYANHAAAEHARRALEIAGRLGDRVPGVRRAHLEELLGESLFPVSEFRASGDAYRRAAALSGDPETRAGSSGAPR
jgi:predicted ATPase